jgi:hypothetical protein
MNARRKWLALILLATLAAAFWPQGQNPDEAVVEAVTRMPAEHRQAAAPAPRADRRVEAVRMTAMQANLFPRQSWAPPPPPPRPQVATPPPPPQAPPLPFGYLGRWLDGGKETVFLLQGDRPLPIQVGQIIAGSWRVDEITRGQVLFTYLPLDMQSTLGITP